MNKIPLQVFSGTTFAHYFSLESIDKGLLAGRKYALVSACFLPVLSLVSTQVASVASIAFMAIAMTTMCVSQVYMAKPEKEERDKVVINLTHKIIAYCFPLGSGLALTAELVSSISTIAAIVSGVAVSMLLSAMMYEPIGRDWNK